MAEDSVTDKCCTIFVKSVQLGNLLCYQVVESATTRAKCGVEGNVKYSTALVCISFRGRSRSQMTGHSGLGVNRRFGEILFAERKNLADAETLISRLFDIVSRPESDTQHTERTLGGCVVVF